MGKINFTKMVASGNDFVLVDNGRKPAGAIGEPLVKKICDRKFGIGADGVLLLGLSRKADVKMRVFNADGSEVDMCGNGARCAALYFSRQSRSPSSPQPKIETWAGIIDSRVKGSNVKIKLTDPKDIKLDIPIKINNRPLVVNFINTGVPHTVIFAEGLGKIDVTGLGSLIRYHHAFAPAGTNVDFVEVLNSNSIAVRTYERGVEDETLACGTGSVASALLYAIRYTLYANHIVKVRTQGGETLKVYFDRIDESFKNIWLEGKAEIVYTGEYHV